MLLGESDSAYIHLIVISRSSGLGGADPTNGLCFCPTKSMSRAFDLFCLSYALELAGWEG